MERNELPCAVFSESITKLNQLHSKWSFVISAMANDLPAPETMLIRSKDDLFTRTHNGGNLFLKPVYSRFASQTMILPLKLALSTLKFDPPFLGWRRAIPLGSITAPMASVITDILRPCLSRHI
ncbi:MAG: hypothetical protein IPJ46_02275 [Anaerolineales bacterium]|nr:hypothetical protein [Anaerolineales bacterium]